MNTYLLPSSDGQEDWIEHIKARSYSEAEAKFVKDLADRYEEVDLGGDLNDARISLVDSLVIGEMYDLEEFNA